jgi:hypothetical protein
MDEPRVKKVRNRALRVARLCKELLADPNKDWRLIGSKKSGELRRASMDLTRALAELRKSS